MDAVTISLAKPRKTKPRGRHPDKALSAAFIRSAPPGRHADGNGLRLYVKPEGTRSWIQRLVVRGRRRELGLATLVVALLVISVRSFAQVPANIDLFVGLEAGASAARSVPAPMRERLVAVDREQLEAARVDANRTGKAMLRLNLFDDVVFNVVVDDTGPTAVGYWLAGHLAANEFSGVTLVVNGKVITGTVRAPRATYAIRSVGNGVHAIRETDPTPATVSRNDVVRSPAPPARPDLTRVQPIRSPTRTGSESRSEIPLEDGSRIDLLVVYTAAAREAHGGREQTEAVSL